ncbi:GGDEF domain-containing protein [Anaerostipes sp.]|uniref:GGDEF domain-containing protein n=1 Tax=Anaerostipes sp. TaxID=1872530 RepID=UPI0025C5BA4A|nr:GGDEF domain-containing protein [Anaerostipes sp.]MBS7009181.1 GGDEF domain-containing protein [Anaerostipes sp.]
MDVLLNILVALEMLTVNMSVVNLCCVRKYSLRKTLLYIVVFSLLLISVSYAGLSRAKNFGNGNGMFTLIGILYLFPLKYLYNESWKRIISIACSSWIYTMLIFSLSVHTAKIFSAGNFIGTVLAVQTILYLITLTFFVSWIKKRLVRVLKIMKDETKNIFLFFSLTWFFTTVLFNVHFTYPQNKLLKIMCLLVLALNASLNFIIIYYLVVNSKDISDLKEIAYVDGLTGLKNRHSLFQDAQELIRRGQRFHLIFIDLDCFKQVNDLYGHLAGDEYICEFARRTERLLKKQSSLYRMSGDEFICIFTDEDPKEFIKKLSQLSYSVSDCYIPFKGCSAGSSSFPEDGSSLDKLISLADAKMYQNKKIKK